MKITNPFARSARQFPQLPDQVPQRGTASSRALFKNIFLAQGWQMVGEFPNLPKAAAIISPHTSNIDAWHGFTALLGLGIKITTDFIINPRSDVYVTNFEHGVFYKTAKDDKYINSFGKRCL